jgi:hypothetical protein
MLHTRSRSPDRKATASATDGVPGPLASKITSTGNTITITTVGAAGSDQKLNIEAGNGTAPELRVDRLINVTQTGTINLDLVNDWRGREIRPRVYSDATNGTPADSAPWVDSIGGGGAVDHVIGHNASADTTFAYDTGTVTVDIKVKANNGNLTVTFGVPAVATWVRVIVDGWTRKTAVDQTL